MKRGRHSPNTKAQVHAIPEHPGYGSQDEDANSSLCGMIPFTDPARWGRGRWFWTDEYVSCYRCLRRLGDGKTWARTFDER